MKKFTKYIPVVYIIGLIIELTINCIAYYGTRLIVGNSYHYNLSNAFDDMVPIVPWMVLIYFGSYIFWALNYVLGCVQDAKTVYRFLSADFLAKIVCLIIFLVFPTTNTRPEIVGSGFFDEFMRFLYSADAADNLFPSIHCLTSWFCVIAVRENKKIPNWYKWVSVIIALAICVSTLTTKQHVIYDVIGGVALAEISYQIIDKVGFSKHYRRCIEKIGQVFNK